MTVEELLTKAKNHYDSGGEPLNGKNCPKYLSVTQKTVTDKYKGTWADFIIEVGGRPTTHIPKHYLVKIGKEYIKNNDEPLIKDRAKEMLGYAASTFRNKFGSWNKYLEAIGQKSTKPTYNISNEKLVEIGKKQKVYLSMRNCEELTNYPSSLMISRFGTWKKYKSLIGQKVRKISHNGQRVDISKTQILERAKNVNTPITKRNCKELLDVSAEVVINRFHGWDYFLDEIGQLVNGSYAQRTVGKDGFFYHSEAEARFSDKFLYNKYQYKNQVLYKTFLNTDKNYTCDFWVEGVGYIEVYSSLNKNNTIKRELAKSQDIKIYWVPVNNFDKYDSLEQVLNCNIPC